MATTASWLCDRFARNLAEATAETLLCLPHAFLPCAPLGFVLQFAHKRSWAKEVALLYSLIIADDEQRIRDGLQRIVDWKQLGFELAGCYSDGQEVLAHLQKSPVDVVLTDICMQRVSGLALAQALHMSYPHTLCVLISGFQEFEFARQAIAYGVEEYLLKPTRLTELQRVFGRIADKLNTVREARVHAQSRQQELERMSEYLRRQFLYDLYMGTLARDEWVQSRLKRFYPEFSAHPSVLLRAWRLRRPTRGEALASEHGGHSIDQILETLFRGRIDEMTFDPVVIEPDRLVVLALVPGAPDDAPSREEAFAKVERALDEIAGQISGMLELSFEFCDRQSYADILSFAHRSRPLLRPSVDGAFQLDAESAQALLGQQRLLLSYLCGRNGQQASILLDSLISQLQDLPLRGIKNILVGVFAQIREKLQELRTLPMDTPLLQYEVLLRQNNLAAVRHWCLQQLAQWMREDTMLPHEKRVISLIRAYVEAEYRNSPSLEKAAEQVFLSPVYVSRLFKQETGQTFTEYIAHVRMEAAKELLANTGLKVYEVGQRVGYPNARYFYRAFKAGTGMTPHEYRQHCERKERP